MFAKKLVLLLIFVLNIRYCIAVRYDNFTLYNILPKQSDQLRFLQNLEAKKYIDVMFWRKPKKLYQSVQVLVNPSNRNLFVERAKHFNLEFNVLISDIQSAFDRQEFQKLRNEPFDEYDWEAYHSLEDINLWLMNIATVFSNITELEIVGKSSEGRNIYSLEIRRVNATRKIFIEGGMHGNEWISTELVTYLIDHIVTAENDEDMRFYNLIKKFRWYFIPIVNPDGYEYSQKVDRLWRKNRRVYGSSVGVDLNKNFDYSFCEYGGSSFPQDNNYCGPKAFSEPETKALSEYIRSKADKIIGYFSFHAYGQKLLIPYGDRIRHVGNFLEMENYGKQAILKMYQVSSNTRKYSIGSAYDTLGMRTSGDSSGWVKKNINPSYVFTFLLRDNGTYGYALPPQQIIPTCEETLAGLIEILMARPRSLRANLFAASATINSTCIFVTFFMLMCTFLY